MIVGWGAEQNNRFLYTKKLTMHLLALKNATTTINNPSTKSETLNLKLLQ